jgi:hypothetical protein
MKNTTTTQTTSKDNASAALISEAVPRIEAAAAEPGHPSAVHGGDAPQVQA